MKIRVVPGHADGGRAAAFEYEQRDYPLVMDFLYSVQGKTLVQSGARIWVVWAGLTRLVERARRCQ